MSLLPVPSPTPMAYCFPYSFTCFFTSGHQVKSIHMEMQTPSHQPLSIASWSFCTGPPGDPLHLMLPSNMNGFYRVILGLLYVDHSFWNSLTFWLLYQMWALCSEPSGSKMPVAGVAGALESAFRKRPEPTSLASHSLCLSWVETLGFLGRHSLLMSSDKLKSESLHMRLTTCRTKLLAISRSQSESCSVLFDSL